MFRRTRLVLFVIAVTVLVSGRPARAEETAQKSALSDLPLEDLLNLKVYAASKFDQEIGRAPASVTIITAEEIRTHGYRTLAEALRNVRGFYISYDRNYSYVGVRGFERPGDYNGRILLLVNGHQLNDTVFEEALIGTESPIDIGLIDRIEIVRGPSSSLYGTSAFFGVVNLITRSTDSLPGLELDGGAGSQLARNIRGSLGHKANGWNMLFSASTFAARGNQHLYYSAFDTPATNNGVVTDADNDQTDSVFASASGHGFDLQGAYGSRTKQIPTASFGTVFGDTRATTRDARGFAELAYTRAVSVNSTLKGRVSYDQYDYHGTYPYEPGLFIDGADNRWLTSNLDVVRVFSQQTVTAGFEVRDNVRQNQSARDQTGSLLDDRRDSTTLAVYAQDEVQLTSHVLLNAGVRWDRYFDTAFGSTINPRIGLIVSPGPASSLKVLYGRAFRAPNPFELYYERDPVSARLKPERISTVEVLWEQRLASRLHVTASVFHNRVSNLINQLSGSSSSIDGLYFDNAQQVSATGVELEAQGDLPGRVHLRVADAVQSAVDGADSSRISNSPAHNGFLVIDMPLGRTGLVAAFDSWFIGSRRSVTGAEVPRAVVSDLTISRAIRKQPVTVGLTVHNVFDVAYSDPGSAEHRQALIPQDGRTVALRATWLLR